MAVEHIKINTNRLHQDTQKVEGYIQKMKKELTNMQNSVNAMNSMWEGSSKKVFVKAFENDMQIAQEIIATLQVIQKYEANAKKEYEACERKVADLVASIRV